jgi:hypothetical protein
VGLILVEIIEEDRVVMKLVAPSSIKLTIEVAHLNHEYHKAFEVFRAGDATAGNTGFECG